MPKVILYIATSQDGFIADKHGDVDWLNELNLCESTATSGASSSADNEDLGYSALIERISIILMGSRSYKQVLTFGEWPYVGKDSYIFTSQPLTSTRPDIFFVSDDVRTFLEKINKKVEKDIWLMGGAELIKSFAKEKLIDECIITIIPKILGEGIKLELPYDDFIMTQSTSKNNIVQQFFLRKQSLL